RVASSICSRLRAREARQQGAQDRSEALAPGSDGPRAEELRRAAAAQVTTAMRRLPVASCLLPFAFCLLPFALLAQQPQQTPTPQQPQQPTFRSTGRVVPVYTTVTDESGQLVLDLTQDDFEIRDNGKVQVITQFSMKLAPMTGTILIDGSQSVVRD